MRISSVLFMIMAILLWPVAARAEGSDPINQSDWRLCLLYPGGAQREITLPGPKDGEYILEDPYIPIRLLAEAAAIPLGWYKSGGSSAVVLGSRPLSLVLIADSADIFYVMDAAASEYTRVYHQQEFVKPLVLGGSFCLPLAFLDNLGLEYRLDALSRTVTVCVPPPRAAVAADKVWQAVRSDVDMLLTPAAVLLGSAVTYFDDSQLDRSQNIYLAADSLHCRTIQPGEVFSFNAAVGRRTPQRGYRKAMIFADGRAIPGYGGGVCQVSTTLYQAALQAGMQIEERHPHSLSVSYAVAGRDAAVVWGSKDLRWRSTAEQPVYLLCRIEGGSLTIEIWQGESPQTVPGILVLK